MSIQAVVSGLALVVAVGGATVLYERNQQLEERLALLEAPGVSAGETTETAAGGPSLSGSGVRRDLAELQGLAEGLVERMDALETREPAGPVSGQAVAERVAAMTSSAEFSDAVRDVVLDMASNDIDFRARVGTRDRAEIPKDSPFTQVAEVLKLDASQESRMSKDLQEMQQELFGLLAEERDDGVIPLEMIAKAEELKEGDPKRAEVFVKLFTLKIPGEEETYMQRAVTLQTDFRKRTLEYLRPEQNEIWDAMKVDWFSIKFN